MISAVSNVSPLFSSTDSSGAGADALGQDAFLKLLITQIEMQDPLEPMQAQEYVAQLAEFSTVEQLQQANARLGILHQVQGVCQALLLIGRTIATADGEISGVVEGVLFTDGQPMLLVDGCEVDPGDVTQVW